MRKSPSFRHPQHRMLKMSATSTPLDIENAKKSSFSTSTTLDPENLQTCECVIFSVHAGSRSSAVEVAGRLLLTTKTDQKSAHQVLWRSPNFPSSPAGDMRARTRYPQGLRIQREVMRTRSPFALLPSSSCSLCAVFLFFVCFAFEEREEMRKASR